MGPEFVLAEVAGLRAYEDPCPLPTLTDYHAPPRVPGRCPSAGRDRTARSPTRRRAVPLGLRLQFPESRDLAVSPSGNSFRFFGDKR